MNASDLARLAIGGGLLGAVILTSVVLYVSGSAFFRHYEIKAGVSRRERARIYLTVVPRWVWNETDWRFAGKLLLVCSLLGVLLVLAGAIFVVGLVEVLLR